MVDSDDDPSIETESDGETVYATPKEERGTITFGSVEKFDKPYKDKDWLFHQYVIAKKTQAEIADETGVVDTTISSWLDKHDIPSRSMSEARRLVAHGTSRPWENDEWLQTEYIEKNKSQSQIANECGVSKHTIHNAISESDVVQSQPIGAKRHRHSIAPKLKDHEWLEREYVEKERSTYDIADELDIESGTVAKELEASGIGTRSRGEASSIRWKKRNSSSRSAVPTPSEGGDGVEESERTAVSRNGSSYNGPSTGIDLSWSDSSDVDRTEWVPYRSSEWLRWQYCDLENDRYRMAEICGVDESTIRNWMSRYDISCFGGDSND